MKIALLTDGIWPNSIGGMQKHSFYLAKYLSINNIKTDLFYCQKGNDNKLIFSQFTQEERENINFIQVEFPKNKFNFPGRYIINSYNYSKEIAKIVNGNSRYDFVYAQGFTPWFLLKNNLNNNIIGSNLHGLEMYQKINGWKQYLIGIMMRLPASAIIKLSDVSFSLGGKLTELLKAKKAKEIRITPIGITKDWQKNLKKTSTIRKFLFIGRNERRKGIEELIKAISFLPISYNFTFDFIGIGKYANTMDNDSKCIYHGEIKDTQEIQKIMSECDVLVCPSLAEGMPTVILEAMAQSMAVIATDTGATGLLVDRNNGLLIKPGDIKELESAISEFIKMDQAKLYSLQQESYNKVENNFLWEKSITTTIAAIRQFI